MLGGWEGGSNLNLSGAVQLSILAWVRGTEWRALPRAYAVHRIAVEEDPVRARERLLSASFDPRVSAVSDRVIPDLAPLAPDGDSVTLVDVAPEEVRIDAHCSSSCLVVLTDFYYHGWEATVDGEPHEIYRVNLLFRGVWAAPGSHKIVYRYRPDSTRAGMLAAGAAMLAILVQGGWLIHRQRSKS